MEVAIVLFQIAMEINQRHTRFSIMKVNKYFVRKKPFKCQCAVRCSGFLFHGASISFFAVTFVDFHLF